MISLSSMNCLSGGNTFRHPASKCDEQMKSIIIMSTIKYTKVATASLKRRVKIWIPAYIDCSINQMNQFARGSIDRKRA